MIPPSLMYQMAQDRQAELLRETEEYRRAGLTVRMRIRARIPRFAHREPPEPCGCRRVIDARPSEDQPPEKGARLRKSYARPSIQSALVSTLEVSDAGPNQLLNEYDTETNAGGDPKQAKSDAVRGKRDTVDRRA